MDIASITATVTGLKTAGDIVNGLLSAKTSTAINAAVAELNSHLISVQRKAMSANAAQLEMVEEIRALKKEITAMKAWGTEKKRYKLHPIGESGSVAYAVKKEHSNGEPPHYICANCYQNNRKSFLDPRESSQNDIVFVCDRCGSKFHTGNSYIEPSYCLSG